VKKYFDHDHDHDHDHDLALRLLLAGHALRRLALG
jgi:hypothetical protein